MSKQRQSVGRRRSRSLLGFASKDLCETIPKSLPPPERLMMLLERSFQYALSAVQKDIMLSDNFDISSFRKDGANCWEKIKSEFEEKNLCTLAVTENTISNQSLLVKAGESEKAMLEAESDKWSETVQHYRKALEKEINNPCTTSADWKGKETLYDYSDVIQYTCTTHENLQKQVELLKKPEITFNKCLKHNSNFDRVLRVRCEKIFESKITNSPRTLIKKMSSARKTPSISRKDAANL